MDEQPASHPRLGQFPPAIVIPPLSSTHNLTIVFLHGRGSNARKFHGPLLESAISNASTAPKLREALPHVRFVFPTAPLARAAKYRRCAIHQWYEGTGDWEPQSRGEMRPGVELVRAVLREEVVRLGGDTRRLVLAGISQGCAMALTSLLLWEGDPLGAVVVMCGFVPLAESLLAIFEEEGRSEGDSDDQGVVFEPDDPFERCDSDDVRTPLQQAIDELRDEAEVPAACPTTTQPFPFLSTPVFMGHGTEDEKVQYQHGQQAAKLLEMMGISVDFRTYPGLGHWYSPDMLGHIVEFLHGKLDS